MLNPSDGGSVDGDAIICVSKVNSGMGDADGHAVCQTRPPVAHHSSLFANRRAEQPAPSEPPLTVPLLDNNAPSSIATSDRACSDDAGDVLTRWNAWRRGYRKGGDADVERYLQDLQAGWLGPEHYCQIERNPDQNGDDYWFDDEVPIMPRWVNGIRHRGPKCLLGPESIREWDWALLSDKYGYYQGEPTEAQAEADARKLTEFSAAEPRRDPISVVGAQEPMDEDQYDAAVDEPMAVDESMADSAAVDAPMADLAVDDVPMDDATDGAGAAAPPLHLQRALNALVAGLTVDECAGKLNIKSSTAWSYYSKALKYVSPDVVRCALLNLVDSDMVRVFASWTSDARDASLQVLLQRLRDNLPRNGRFCQIAEANARSQIWFVKQALLWLPADEFSGRASEAAGGPQFEAASANAAMLLKPNAAHAPQYSLMKTPWRTTHLDADSERLPEMRSPGYEWFQPGMHTQFSKGDFLVVQALKGVGKSYITRQFSKTLLRHSYGRVVYVVSRQTYGTNLTGELRRMFEEEHVWDYQETAENRQRFPIKDCHQHIVISLQSLQLMDGIGNVVLVVLDEIRTTGDAIGGKTMEKKVSNISGLQRMCTAVPYLVGMDADIEFLSIDATKDVCQLFAPGRAVHHVKLSGQPQHLRRTFARCWDQTIGRGKNKSNPGKRTFRRKLIRALEAWKEAYECGDFSKRVAICISTRTQADEIIKLLNSFGTPFEIYRGDSCKNIKARDLQHPDFHWEPLGGLLFTTSLSVGVDPQTVKFARVFGMTSRTGCGIRDVVQAFGRFGRSVDYPLDDNEIVLLIHGMRPKASFFEDGTLNMQTVMELFDQCLASLLKEQQHCMGYTLQLADAAGEPAVFRPLQLQALRVQAWNDAARKMQQSHHNELVLHALYNAGYTPSTDDGEVEDGDEPKLPEGRWEGISKQTAFTSLPDHRTSPVRYEWALKHIAEKGVEQFFDDCYGVRLSTGNAAPNQSGTEAWLWELHKTLDHIGQLPPPLTGLSGEELAEAVGDVKTLKCAATTLKEFYLNVTSMVRNAEVRVLGGQELLRRDHVRTKNQEVQIEHAMQNGGMPGIRFDLMQQAAVILGVPNFYEPFTVPEAFLQLLRAKPTGLQWRAAGQKKNVKKPNQLLKNDALANALRNQTEFTQEEWDTFGVKKLRPSHKILSGTTYFEPVVPEGMKSFYQIAEKLHVGGRQDSVKAIVDRLVEHVGCVSIVSELRPNGEARQLIGFRTERRLPEIADAIFVKSSRLGRPVRVGEWEALHYAEDERDAERVGAAIEGVLVEPPAPEPHVISPADRARCKLERYEASMLRDELRAVDEKETLTRYESGCQTWLRDFRGVPSRTVDGEVEHLTVFSQRKIGLGRRYASGASGQNCPSKLYKRLQGHRLREADISNANPNWTLQLLRQVNVSEKELPSLIEYVETDGGRDRIVAALAEHYEVPKPLAKKLVLAIVTGGTVEGWRAACRDEGAAVPNDNGVPIFIEDLQAEMTKHRSKIFQHPRFKDGIDDLRREVKSRHQFLSRDQMERKLFAQCLQRLEDHTLSLVDERLTSMGWTVEMLKFDALLVVDRADRTFADDLAKAVRDVIDTLSITFTMKETDFFTGGGE